MLQTLLGYADLFRESYTYRITAESYEIGKSVLPGLAFGLLVSSSLIAWWPVQHIDRIPRKYLAGSVVMLAVLGVVSPFCSYLAVPIAAALMIGGIPPAPVVAFLFASPLMNPTLFFMTVGVFGWPMALARALAAIGFGILGGCLALRYNESLLRFFTARSTSADLVWERADTEVPYIRRWWNALRHLSLFTVKYVTIGVVLAAMVSELIPMEWVEAAVGRAHGYNIIVGAMLGIPLYACGGGTIPFVEALMRLGMSPGAALAFFIAGPSTKLPMLVTLKMTAGLRLTAAYVALNLAWAVLAGAVFQGVSG